MVECHLAKVDVEGSNPFSRSPKAQPSLGFFRFRGIVAREGWLCITTCITTWVVMTPSGSMLDPFP